MRKEDRQICGPGFEAVVSADKRDNKCPCSVCMAGMQAAE
jgi:hypothetical protein